MDSLKKSMSANYFSFFNILIGTLSKIWFKVKKLDKRAKVLFYNVFCEFERLPNEIWKKEEHFAFILFCKESKSAVRFQKFLIWIFDIPMPHLDLWPPWPEPKISKIAIFFILPVRAYKFK